MMDFRDNVVVVTGAGRGIGAAIAEAFASAGGTVAVNYRTDREAAERVAARCRAKGGDAMAIQADVTDAEAVAALMQTVVDEFGRIDALVNNAFAPYAFDPEKRQRFDTLQWEAYRAQFDGSVGAAFNACRAVIPHFRRAAKGAIVNIVTNLVEHPIVPYHEYSTAKSALVGFSRNLAAELGPLGVRVNCVAPGLVYPTRSSEATRASFRDAIADATPLGRIARPEDVAGPVLFLASDWSRFMTGQVLFVDGGMVMR
jgi:3-oxoacyl-[acyl-carrier protein] reductase